MFLQHPLFDDVTLVLREDWTVGPLSRVVERCLERFREFEDWAWTHHTREDLLEHTRRSLRDWVDGTSLPLAILVAGEPVGIVGARLDHQMAIAQIGYWLDTAHEGRGIVTTAVRELTAHLIDDRGMARVEIRTSAGNRRSQQVARRLGFTEDARLRSALPVGTRRDDELVFALLAGEERA